ncbi:MAG: hypothetical protein ACHQ9S_12115 [Candidatus Binatia bacterium]
MGLLSGLYPDSIHVRNVGLARADDALVLGVRERSRAPRGRIRSEA